MKRFNNTVYLAAALICASLAAAGCGSSNTNPAGTGTTASGVTYSSGSIVTGVGGSIGFSGNNVYDTGAAIVDETAGFTPNQGGDLVLNGAGVAQGTAGSLYGITQGGSTIVILQSQGSGQCSWGIGLCATVAGTINVSAADSQAAGGVGTIQGVYLSLTLSGGEISMGNAYICTQRDQSGNCHGIVLSFIPH